MKASWTTRLPALVRTTHLYASLLASFAIAFFAATGLVGELRGPDGSAEGEPPTVPAALLSERPALAAWLATQMAVTTSPGITDDGDALVAQAADGEDLVEAIVALPSRVLAITRWHPLPAAAQLDRAWLARWCAQQLGREPTVGDDPDDAQAPRVQLVVESVWWTRTVTIDRLHRRWSEHRDRRTTAAALAELHSGKHASWGQRRLMDAAAITLLFSTLTGLAMGLVWVGQRRRRLALATLLGGCTWLVLLVISR